MPLISFSGETYEGPFWKQIREWRKTQTCRKRRKRPIKKGDILYLYWKVRVPKAKKPIHFIGAAHCTNVEYDQKYSKFAFDDDFARRDGFHDALELQNWFGDPFEYHDEEYDVISFALRCETCGHFHSPGHICSNAFCFRCGLGGNLTYRSCEEHLRIRKMAEEILCAEE